MTEVTVTVAKKVPQFFELHESGKNRAQRRLEASLERNKPFKNANYNNKKGIVKAGEDRIRTMWKRGEEARKRALIRKAKKV